MFDFIKKLFKKPSKAPVKKRSCASCSKQAICPKNEASGKKEEKIPALIDTNVIEVSPITHTESAEVVEENTVIKIEEIPSTVVDSSDVTEETQTKNSVSEAQYIIKLTGKDSYRFELVSPEGKSVVKSEVYTLKRSCVSGIQSVRKNGATENVEDRTVEAPIKVPNPNEIH